MRTSSIIRCPAAVVTTAVFACLAWSVAATAQDFGDHSSATLTTKAWTALADGQHELALAYTGKCRELYAGEAATQQAALADFAPADKAHDSWALNDVGTCLLIEGQVREKQGMKKEAIAAYRKLSDELKFCQCRDTKGWFWHPADVAATKLKQLEFDAQLE